MRWSALLVVLLVAACADSGQPAQSEFASPDRLLGYTYAGGTIKPIPSTHTGIVRDTSLQSAY
ncbi:MAG: hypothetical protein GEV13_21905 [Rhodospirillales bacterium]|nr:hypothetical protein [Rhodospirillales bacterium]